MKGVVEEIEPTDSFVKLPNPTAKEININCQTGETRIKSDRQADTRAHTQSFTHTTGFH